MTLTLTNEQARLWVRWLWALREGYDPLNPERKYKQGQHCLRRGDEFFCCLGVGSDISGVGEWGGPYSGGARSYRVGGSPHYSTEPKAVDDAFGAVISEIDAYLPDIDADSALPLDELNDAGVPFPRLADIIEARLATATIVEAA